MIMILLYFATGGLILFTIVLADELRRIRRAKRLREQHAPQPTVLDEVRELRQLGATIDAQATDLTTRLEALEKTLAESRVIGPKARPEPVAPRSG
jgi:hypothetical protein